jgi:ribonuclease T1
MRDKRTLAGLVAALLTAVLIWWSQGDAGTQQEPTADETSSVETTAPSPSDDSPSVTLAPESPSDSGPSAPGSTSSPEMPAADGTDPESGLLLIPLRALPPEAHETLALIDAGGPFPHDRDGVTFENREGLLPDHPEGYYAEYTVETPGSDDRGARRIVVGDGGELYYTQDHYASFGRIDR